MAALRQPVLSQDLHQGRLHFRLSSMRLRLLPVPTPNLRLNRGLLRSALLLLVLGVAGQAQAGPALYQLCGSRLEVWGQAVNAARQAKAYRDQATQRGSAARCQAQAMAVEAMKSVVLAKAETWKCLYTYAEMNTDMYQAKLKQDAALSLDLERAQADLAANCR